MLKRISYCLVLTASEVVIVFSTFFSFLTRNMIECVTQNGGNHPSGNLLIRVMKKAVNASFISFVLCLYLVCINESLA